MIPKFFAVIAFLLTGVTPLAAQTVITRLGPVTGVIADGVSSFKAIPYAAPPVGPLRWTAPRPPAPWTKPLKADTFGPACWQPRPSTWGGDPKMSEDCLTLNVWTPQAATPRAKLPVMVWIYGGGFTVGHTAMPMYDGAKLAKASVVLVSLNYRVGRFGWFAYPELTREAQGGGTANFGLMDQIAALKWVRENIAAFGGDPANVTIFGESAGGMSVNLLMVSPAARGLFAKAITESGLGRNEARPLNTAEAIGTAFAAAKGAKTLADLRVLPPEAIVSPTVNPEGNDRTGPVVDGVWVPENVDVAFAAGREAKVPWIVGSNSYEASLFGLLLAHPEVTVFPTIPSARKAEVLAALDPGSGDKSAIAAQYLIDKTFTEPARQLSTEHEANGAKSWRYVFAYTPDAQRADLPGAGHGSEVQYVFGTLGTYHDSPQTFTLGDRAIGEAMSRYWVNFARTGDPNGAGASPWPQDRADETLLIEPGGPRPVYGFRKARLDLMTSIAAP